MSIPQLFNACQDVVSGRNRRTGNPDILFSGGIIRCGCCQYAMTGEIIRRKLKSGGCNSHTYYRCGNDTPERRDTHPKVRWREVDVEAAIERELATIALPEFHQRWFRHAIEAAFDDVSTVQATSRKMLHKRRTELQNMQDRLLNSYLAGTIDESIFQIKSADLKSQLKDVEEQLQQVDQYDPAYGKLALTVFDFSQNLMPLWRGSNSAQKREILEVVSSNRMLDDVSLVLKKRKPFDFLAERPFLKKSRGGRIRTDDFLHPKQAL